jgi:hypothetical protein
MIEAAFIVTCLITIFVVGGFASQITIESLQGRRFDEIGSEKEVK